MIVLDIQSGKRQQNGWVHFPCPFCPQKGRGPDPSYHLGVHLISRGIRCWRCGTTRLPKGTILKGWKGGPRPDPGAWGEGDVRPIVAKASWMRYTGPIASPWPLHTPEALRAMGAIPVQTKRGPAWLLSFEGTDGYQIRYLDGGEPKVRNFALRGPGLLRPQGPVPDMAVVVEGWGDALPFHGCTYALLGTSNWLRLDLKSFPQGWLLALDNDGPGRLCRDSITRACLKLRVPVAWVTYEGKDPAESKGPFGVKDIRTLRDMNDDA